MSRYAYSALLVLLCQAPVYAEQAPVVNEPAPAATTPAPAPQAEPKANATSVLLEYQIQDDSMLSFDLANDPLTAVLTVLQQSALIAKQKQTLVETRALLKGTAKLAPLLEKVPPIELQTTVTDGVGQTIFTHAKFQHSHTEGKETGTLVWDGLQGQLDFKEDLQEPHFKAQAPSLDFKLEGKEPAAFNLQQLSVEFSLDADKEPSLIDVQIPAASMTADNSRMTLSGLQLHAQMEQPQPGLKLVNAQAAIAALSFQDEKRNPPLSVDLQGLQVDANSHLDSDLVSYDLNIRADKMAVPPEIIESGNSTLSYQSELSLQRLDAGALTELQKAIRMMKQQNMPPEMMGLVLMGKVMELLPALAAKSPQLTLSKLNVNADNGRVEGHLRIGINGDKPLNFANPAALLQALDGEAEFRVSKILIEESLQAKFKTAHPDQTDDAEKRQQFIADGFAKIEQQGFLVPDGEDYKLSAQIKAGQAQLNGKPMPLPGMSGSQSK